VVPIIFEKFLWTDHNLKEPIKLTTILLNISMANINPSSLFYAFLACLFIEIIIVTQYFVGNLAYGLFYVGICIFLFMSLVFLALLIALTVKQPDQVKSCKTTIYILMCFYVIIQIMLVGVFTAFLSDADKANFGVTRIVTDSTGKYLCEIKKWMNFMSLFFYMILVIAFWQMIRMYKAGSVGYFLSLNQIKQKIEMFNNAPSIILNMILFGALVLLALFSFNTVIGGLGFLMSYTIDLFAGMPLGKYEYGCEVQTYT
jgi:hypothetical protein